MGPDGLTPGSPPRLRPHRHQGGPLPSSATMQSKGSSEEHRRALEAMHHRSQQAQGPGCGRRLRQGHRADPGHAVEDG
eukprot:11098526-Heterocapsa_arctica.AAC.1